MPDFKVLAVEDGGGEFEFRKELLLDASNVKLDEPSFTAGNVEGGLVEARDTATGFFAQEAFSVATTSSTTSNGWVTKTGYPYTSSTKDPGDYVIDFTAELGQSDKEKQVGSRIQWRIGTAGSWNTVADIRDAVSRDNAYQLRTGFFIITVPSTNVIQLRWQFGQTDDGGTGRIRNAGVKITRRA